MQLADFPPPRSLRTFAGPPRSEFAPAGRPDRVRRVLMTADAVGGVWRYSIDLGRTLGERGVQTTLAVMGPSPDAAQRREAELAGIPLVARPYRLEWMENPWDDVDRAGKWLLALERLLLPDIVHLNGYTHAALPWCAPVVVVAHSCVRSWWRAVKGEGAPAQFDQYHAAVRSGLNAARLVVAPTAAMLDALREEYNHAAWSRVIANGAPPAATATEPVWADKEPVILAAGRLWDEAKNVDAVCRVAPEWPWPVCVAGDDTAPDRQRRPLQNVQALGRLSAAGLAAWQRRAGIYVGPARYEPFGLAVLEAAAAGCALVLGDIPSLRENWEGAALFVPPDDSPALRDAVRVLIDDDEYRRDLGRRAWRRATSFTTTRSADEYLRAYQDVL